jgi:hypothetical protein
LPPDNNWTESGNQTSPNLGLSWRSSSEGWYGSGGACWCQ